MFPEIRMWHSPYVTDKYDKDATGHKHYLKKGLFRRPALLPKKIWDAYDAYRLFMEPRPTGREFLTWWLTIKAPKVTKKMLSALAALRARGDRF
jgi:hypothetical protein